MFSNLLKGRLRKHDQLNNRKLESILRVQLLQQQILGCTEKGVGNDKAHNIVVSLTSFDRRIHNVAYAVESVFQQWLKADVVVLWLSREQFPDGQLPESLVRQQKRGLQIFYIEDLGPYTKYFYAFEQYPDSLIITVDDDTLYPPDMIDQLYRAWLRNPTWIHCHRAHRMQLDKHGKLKPYSDWCADWRWRDCDGESSPLVFPTGVGGVLYFPGSLHPDAFAKEKFLKLCPGADDVWLKAMSLLQGTPCARLADPRDWSARFLTVAGSQEVALQQENWRAEGGNDCKIRAVFEKYDLYGLLGGTAR
ncbi:hypothetical protein [Microbulbifer elongatus]|uniref:hypothetical protein n=1 Tax=Microbulbifer elongatus TaxID=86173 RepID=UPI001E6120C2|nr:hypothetical protein [Microbulbifer elongatus]